MMSYWLRQRVDGGGGGSTLATYEQLMVMMVMVVRLSEMVGRLDQG